MHNLTPPYYLKEVGEEEIVYEMLLFNVMQI